MCQDVTQEGWYCRTHKFLNEDEVNYDFTCVVCGGIVFWHKEDEPMEDE